MSNPLEAWKFPDDPVDGRPGLRVLVAADNPISLKVLARLLERIGCSVESVTNISLAVQALERREHDLILMDVEMPGIDGRSATSEIRRIEVERGIPQVPILAMTAPEEHDGQPSFLEVGMDGHLTSPLTLQSLRDSLSEWGAPARVLRRADDPGPAEVEGLLDLRGVDRRLNSRRINACLAKVPESLRFMAEAVDAGDFRRLAVEVLGLKWEASIIGADDLARRCQVLEQFANLKEPEGCRRSLAALEIACGSLRSAMEPVAKELP